LYQALKGLKSYFISALRFFFVGSSDSSNSEKNSLFFALTNSTSPSKITESLLFDLPSSNIN